MDERYSRQTRFVDIGEKGQRLIRQKHVAIIGAGALGTSNAEMLVRAGVGQLTLVDRDYVERSNLQRQQLYTEADAEKRLPKVVAAKKRLQEINSDVHITIHIEDFHAANAYQLIGEPDVLIDATDNFETRQLINDISQKSAIPWIYGAATGSYGLTYTFLPGITPCFSCLYKNLPVQGDTCDTVGVISPIIQMVSAHQTTEVLKLLTEKEDDLRGTLLYFDVWKNEHTSIRMDGLKSHDCPSCGENAVYPSLSPDHHSKSAVLCGRDTVQIRPTQSLQFDYIAVQSRLKDLGLAVDNNSFLTNVIIDPYRLVIFHDGRTLIHGTKDVHEARKIYRQYIGG